MHAKRIPCEDGNSVIVPRVAGDASSLGFTDTEDGMVALGLTVPLGLCCSEVGPGPTFAGP